MKSWLLEAKSIDKKILVFEKRIKKKALLAKNLLSYSYNTLRGRIPSKSLVLINQKIIFLSKDGLPTFRFSSMSSKVQEIRKVRETFFLKIKQDLTGKPILYVDRSNPHD